MKEKTHVRTYNENFTLMTGEESDNFNENEKQLLKI